MNDQDIEVVEAMRRYGGGFVKALAEAVALADSVNLERIKNAFPEFWKGYRDLARQMRAINPAEDQRGKHGDPDT